MTPAWVDKARTTPRQHQIDGVAALVRHPYFFIADQVGAGKSKQCVDTAQILYQAGMIDTALVLAPKPARGVWGDPDLGEIAKHGWESVENRVREYSVRFPRLGSWHPGLNWIIANYEFARRPERLAPLLSALKGRKVLLICDEAWALKDHRTDTWKATNKIRAVADRVVLLNGTPVADTPLDLFAQMKLLDPNIIGIKYFTHFRARYAMLAPNVSFPKITGWQNLEELRARVEPYVLRRLTRDCFDLPEELEPVLLEAPLGDNTWRVYKEMRDEMVAWLDTATGTQASIAQQAIVKALRLRQITSGLLGGVASDDGLDVQGVQVMSREKQYALLEWLDGVDGDHADRALVWGIWRPEVFGARELWDAHGRFETHSIYGGQREDERKAAEMALQPGLPKPTKPVRVFGNPQAGGASLNCQGASVAATLSHHPSLRVYLQSRGRIDRPGQVNRIRYVDVVATGPQGQRTIDHHTLAALRKKEDVATWTTATWRKKLLEE